MSVEVVELTDERRRLIKKLSKCAYKTTKLNGQIAEQQSTCMALTCENDELNKTVDEIFKKYLRVKGA